MKESALLALVLAACQGWEPLDAAALRALPESPPAALACDGTVEVDTPALRGLFTARLVARCERPARVRLQLFPDLGGKVLDVALDAERVRGVIPQAGLRVDRPFTALDQPNLLVLIALTLRAELTPLLPGRIDGMRRKSTRLELRTREPDCGMVVVHVFEHGGLRRRELAWRGLRWSIVCDGPGLWRIETPDGGWRIAARMRATDPAPEELFRPELR